jgi:hypothetical protein
VDLRWHGIIVGECLLLVAEQIAPSRVRFDNEQSTKNKSAGTKMLMDIAPGSASSNPIDFTLVGGVVYFSADNGVNGRELWYVSLRVERSGCVVVHANIFGNDHDHNNNNKNIKEIRSARLGCVQSDQMPAATGSLLERECVDDKFRCAD